MSDHEARARAVYDHDEDEPRPSGRRRRQVADWGVNEELFDGMPGRRFDRRGEEHRIPRGGADDGRRTIVITQSGAVEAPLETADEEFASREDALRAREQHDAVWAGDEPFAEPEAEVRAYVAEPSLEVDEGPAGFEGSTGFEATAGFEGSAGFEATREREYRTDSIVRGGVEGRRTVKIGGRPGEFQPSPERRRPARTVHERVGPRPDRIAAWACALGLLLIIIAIATASI
jgi:hypothetical protein